MEVIPAINSESFDEIENQIKMVEPFLITPESKGWVQIDVADGTFTKNTLWHNASDLLRLETNLNIEVHLMISDIEKRVDNWLLAPVKRVIFHLETAKDPHFIVKKCKDAGKEVGVAIGPDTPWTQLMPFCDRVDLFQILAVYPGLPGQKFIEDNLDKIDKLRKNCDSVIEVDGGINKDIAQRCKEAGADAVVAASYIFNSDNIGEKIEELKRV